MFINNISLRRRNLVFYGLAAYCFPLRAEPPPPSAAEWLFASGLVRDRAIEGVLSLTRFRDEIYILNSEINWQPNTTSSLSRVTVPRGFVTDLASIPRVFFSLFRPDGTYAYAAILHDYLYWEQRISRRDANKVFFQAMDDLRISPLQRRLLFDAVEYFGERSWSENTALKRKGERRVLKVFPSSPSITWSEWKIKPNVFAVD